MKEKHNIVLPKGICANLSDQDFNTMTTISLSMSALWENALGVNWKEKISAEKLKAIYKKI